MTRRTWVYIGGEVYEKGTEPVPTGVMFVPDLPEFTSPIDGKQYSGRAGMREHCALHNVVPTADLKGLPFKPAVQEYVPDRAAIRETIIRTMHQKGYIR